MTGSGGGAGIDPERVAELIVTTTGPGPGRRGSGYRVTAQAVLTAAHVVRDEAGVRVRFDADRSGEWVAEGRVAWSDPEIDVAVVAITPRPNDEGRVQQVGFGRVAERDAVLECSAMGFPWFKLRDDPAPAEAGPPPRYRDSVHVVGTIAVLSNRREGTLEVSVPAPGHDPDPRRSPWDGISGAAVWSAGRVIGLVAEHHLSDGLGRLAATRVDRWYERLSPARLGELRDLTGLPATADGLRDVVRPTGSELVEAGYLAQVRDRAPEELLGREQELAELVRFCAGDEPYLWWRAEAWAGKSALAAWFVAHPPAGVRVVSFFVTRRLAGQADSIAFTEAMVEQLAAVADESASMTPSGRDRERVLLLEQAARRVAERQERLLLVVDGLDEDEGAPPASRKPSIASLLPRRPASNVRVLVTSRPHPGIPSDVPGDHPLRRCVPRTLEPSPFARHIELAATNELMEQLHGGALQETILGYIAASGGGLTLADLAELTGSPQWKLDGILGTVFGRSLMTLTQRGPLPAGPDDVIVYVFAHETLNVAAQEKLGSDLRGYRRRIDSWADGYRERGWPAETPVYLLWPYGKLLGDEDKGDLHRLAELATDPRRHDRLLAATMGDGDAIAELVAAQKLALQQAAPDLATLGRLAVHRDRLEGRNENLPVELPGLLVRLGQRRRGEAIAKGMPGHSQPKAFAAIAAALADAGRWERAATTARELTDADAKARALAAVGRAMIEADRERALGLLDEAAQAARSVPETYVRPFALAAVAEAFAAAGLWEHAGRIAHAIDPMYAAAGARALRSVVDALAANGQWDRAEQTARAVPGIWEKAAAMASLGGAMAGQDPDRAESLRQGAEGLARGHYPITRDSEPVSAICKALSKADRDRASRLLTDIERNASRIPHPDGKESALVAITRALADLHDWEQADRVAAGISGLPRADATRALAEALARAGQWDRAEHEIRAIPYPRDRAETLIAVATTAVLAHAPERAFAMATDAEQIARGIPHAGRFWALQAVARAQAAAGQVELAERAARDLSPPDLALRAVAEAQTAAGQWDRAERTALDIAEPDNQVAALTAVAGSMAGAGQWDRAERVIRHLADRHPAAYAEALAALAEEVAEADQARASALAADAQRVARGITDAVEQQRASVAVARALAAARQWDDAETTAWDILDADVQREALGAVAAALVAVDRPRGVALADHMERETRHWTPDQPLAQAFNLGGLAVALANVDRERALALAAEAEQAVGEVEETGRDEALAVVASALAAVERWDRAERAVMTITDADTLSKALGDLAGALVDAGRWDDAQRITTAILDPEAKVQALAALAGSLVTVDPERALAVAAEAADTVPTIPGRYDQGKAWALIVELLTAASASEPVAGDALHQQVRRLLAEVLAGARWLDALETLGKLEPEALAAVDRELRR
jgi:hypothetical protein